MDSKTNFLPSLAIIMWVMCIYRSEVSAVVHIAPNAASCGEVENCTSLTDYAQMLSVNPSVSTDLLFLPGNHILYNYLCLVSDVTLLGDCSSNESCPLITCIGNSDIEFDNVTRTIIMNLRFANCLVYIDGHDSINNIPENPDSVKNSSLQITNCSFSHTNDKVLLIENSFVIIEDSSFTNISAREYQCDADGSGIVMVSYSYVTIEDCSFTNITSDQCAPLSIDSSIAHFNGNNSFRNNRIDASGVLALYWSNATFSDNTLFCNNSGMSLYVSESNVTFNGTTIFRLGNSSYIGALYSDYSTVSFYGVTLFEENIAEQIGALGGRFSWFNVFGNLTFYNNTATQLAGGLGLIDSSQIYLAQGSEIIFELNSAGFGGAIFVEDAPFCSEPRSCFFQVMDYDNYDDPHVNINLTFINNSATFAGDDIYGGNIDECNQSLFDSITTFHHDSPTISKIASNAIQVCECVNDTPVCPDYDPYCSVDIPDYCAINRAPYPGQSIQVTVAAVGQGGGVVPAGIRTLTYNPDSENFIETPFSNFETIRGINATCTTLSYTVVSSSMVEVLHLYPRPSICPETDIPLTIALLYKQTCPHGFEKDSNTSACVCEKRLRNTEHISCNITYETFQHRGENWIGFDNSSNGLIIHDGSCPFDYCITNHMVNFTLEDTQKQCSFHRSGLLCGECQDGLSVKLGGTSRCERCSNDRLALLIPFVIAGIGLVVLLFVCELSVVAGTLSGLIFYANVVQINRVLFFKSNNVLTVFIAWLNLDLGIETCFYDGMDSYGKTWLQFLFPFYIWAIVGLIILLSSYSKRVTKVLGSHPIAVLATLFLLSYVKILRVLVSVVSFTRLHYPNQTALVWKSDANIEYVKGKHIPLFVVAVLVFLLLFVPYTVLLLFGHWFQTKAHWKCMTWAKSQRLKAFLDVYHAPYKDQHRYWPGLLLLFRIALAVTTAIADESLLAATYAVIVTVLLVQLWGWTARGVYKKWPLDTLEAVFFVNLGLLMFATYHIKSSGGNQMAAASTSVSITLLVFVGILLYHILVLRLKLEWVSAKHWIMKIKKIPSWKKAQRESNISPLNVSTNTDPVTVSYVSFRELLLEEDPN